MDSAFLKEQLLSRFRLMARFIPGNDYQHNKFLGDTAVAFAAACENQPALSADDRSALQEMRGAVDICFNHMSQHKPGLDFKINDAIAACGLASAKLTAQQNRPA